MGVDRSCESRANPGIKSREFPGNPWCAWGFSRGCDGKLVAPAGFIESNGESSQPGRRVGKRSHNRLGVVLFGIAEDFQFDPAENIVVGADELQVGIMPPRSRWR